MSRSSSSSCKFSLLQEMSGIDADQSLDVLESIDRDVSEDEASNSDLHLALPDNKAIPSLKIEESEG